MSIWNDVNGEKYIGTISGTLKRLVESQQHIATLSYVDTLEEQALLEELLDEAKPPCPKNSQDYHYLLKTPFRYPPLKWGSRFGRTYEPSLFYAGINLDAILAESAYYRFVFWYSMSTHTNRALVRTQHTLFSVPYLSQKGITLHQTPFLNYEALLTDPKQYSITQELGSQMRESGVEAFEYVSARDQQRGLCIGLFTPAAFRQMQPHESNQWLCELSDKAVTFKEVGSSFLHEYSIEQFLVDGSLPFPA